MDEEKKAVVREEKEPAVAQECPAVQAEGCKLGKACHYGVDTEYEAHERPAPGGNIQLHDHPAVINLDQVVVEEKTCGQAVFPQKLSTKSPEPVEGAYGLLAASQCRRRPRCTAKYTTNQGK